MIKDEIGYRLFRGFNFGSEYKSISSRFIAVDKATWQKRIDALGANLVRLAWFWDALEPEDGDVDQTYAENIAAEINKIRECGAEVILCAHQDVFGSGFGFAGIPKWVASTAIQPRNPWFLNYANAKVGNAFNSLLSQRGKENRLAKAWNFLLEHLQDDVFALDLLNEPFIGKQTIIGNDRKLEEFHQDIVLQLQSTSSRIGFEPHLLFAAGLPSRMSSAPGTNPLFVPHLYPPQLEMGSATASLSIAKRMLRRLQKKSETLETPILVGEFGARNNIAGASAFVRQIVDEFDKQKLSACVWDVGAKSEYSVLDSSDIRNPIGDAFARPFVEFVDGQLEQMSWDRQKLSIRWRGSHLRVRLPHLYRLSKYCGAGKVEETERFLDISGSGAAELYF